MVTTTTNQRPKWLVIVRFGGLIAVLGILIALIGSFAGFAFTQLGIYVLLAGGIIALAGIIYRVARGSERL